MKFIDLFAGLGGFHQALASRGAKCVFASESNPELAGLYKRNFGIMPAGDIREVDIAAIPDHDILCAGFPCQPFSKAGNQKGLECPQWGDLFNYIVEILDSKHPRNFIIENVPNLIGHDQGKTWNVICDRLEQSGYSIEFARLSPHMFGIPQKRMRAFIVGDRLGLDQFTWPIPDKLPRTSINSVLDRQSERSFRLNANHLRYLEAWQEFLISFPVDQQLPGFPIWAMEFGANYPLDGFTPYADEYFGLGQFKGAFGVSLSGLSPEQVEASLPPYARTTLDRFPDWKMDFIVKNREFYKRHRKVIDPWIDRIKDFPSSFQKFEWNCGSEERSVWKHLIQFRSSGIRVKKKETAPSLVAMSTSHVPIIGWKKRYMTPLECSRLQSMGSLCYLPEPRERAYKAFGNAVNVDVVRNIYDALMRNTRAEDMASIAMAAE